MSEIDKKLGRRTRHCPRNGGSPKALNYVSVEYVRNDIKLDRKIRFHLRYGVRPKALNYGSVEHSALNRVG